MSLSPAGKATFLSIGVFLLSLPLPAFTYVSGGHQFSTVSGVEALGMGWFPAIFAIAGLPRGDFTYVPTLAWVANPCLAVAWVACFIDWRKGAIGFAIASLVLALMSVFAHRIPIPDGQTMSNIDLSGGFFLWIGAMLVTLVVAFQVDVSGSKRSLARRG